MLFSFLNSILFISGSKGAEKNEKMKKKSYFNEYLLSIYYMPDISGSTGDTIVSRTDNICGLMKIIF